MRFVFLGTGGAYPTKDRNVSALAMQAGGSVYLFDCGEGTQRQLLYTTLSFQKIKRIYITHLHGDHFFGLPGLVQTMGLNHRSEPLLILGPKDSGEQLRNFIGAGFGFVPFEIEVREVGDGDEDSDEEEELLFTSRYVDHTVPSMAISVEERPKRGKFDREKAESLGVPAGPLFSRLTSGSSVEIDGRTILPEDVMGPPRPGRKFVHSGDTSPCGSINELAKDADVLVYESTFEHELADKALSFKHSTNIQAAELARDCGVKHLILNHLSPRYSFEEVEAIVQACREVFPNTHAASDLEEYILTGEGLRSSRER